MNYIDLSHLISKNTKTYPSDPDIEIKIEKKIATDNSLLHSFKLGTHTGTHLDAPAHILEKTKTIDCFPINKFSGKAIKIDTTTFREIKLKNHTYDGIIFDTGWHKNFRKPDLFYSSKRPEIPEQIIEKLIEQNIKFFGCDLPSVDISGSKKKPVHKMLLKNEIIIYESLANLNQLPFLKEFDFFGFPLPIKNLEGSPVRAVARL